MRKIERNLYLLYMMFGVALITANCIATKLFDTGIQLLGSNITITCGVICYPMTFLITDVIGEIWGKKEANDAVKFGFICQLVSTLFVTLARYMPAADMEVQSAYVSLLGQSWIFVVASLTAYLCSQSCDVTLFHAIRELYIKRHGSTDGGKWIWNNVATITSQLVDSSVYVVVAFGIGFGWAWTPEGRTSMFGMIVGQWLFKVVLALLDTPFFYFLTRNSRGEAEHVAE